MYKKTIAVALLYALFATPVAAQNYVINVNGIVCEFCAYGVGKKIRKLSFIDPSQYDEGVKVDIENQRVFIALREGSTLDKSVLFKAIESGGYDPIDIQQITAGEDSAEVVE
jgi:mercuric ion binding protein